MLSGYSTSVLVFAMLFGLALSQSCSDCRGFCTCITEAKQACSSSEGSSETQADVREMFQCVEDTLGRANLPACFDECRDAKINAATGNTGGSTGNRGNGNNGGRGGRRGCMRDAMQQCEQRYGCASPGREFRRAFHTCKRNQ